MKLGGGAILLVAILALLSGQDPGQLIGMLEGAGQAGGGLGGPVEGGGAIPAGDEQAEFVSVVLADTEDTWKRIFAASGQTYPPPKLVLFRGSIQSACGFNSAAVGPFYCPGDRKVYIDLSFFRDLQQRFGAPGDFAQAYVIAHEVGHHIQQVTGVSEQVRRAQAGRSRADANALSVMQELQADCYAGVWGHHAGRKDLLERGDIEEGLRAAAAIGDDRLQRQAQGYTHPESWTHGSSEQRVRWFRRGLETGDVGQCDTYRAGRL